MEIVTGLIRIDDRNQIRVRAAVLLSGPGLDQRRFYLKDGQWFPTRAGIWVRSQHMTMLTVAISDARDLLKTEAFKKHEGNERWESDD